MVAVVASDSEPETAEESALRRALRRRSRRFSFLRRFFSLRLRLRSRDELSLLLLASSLPFGSTSSPSPSSSMITKIFFILPFIGVKPPPPALCCEPSRSTAARSALRFLNLVLPGQPEVRRTQADKTTG